MKNNKKHFIPFVITLLCSLMIIPFLKGASIRPADAEPEYSYVILDDGSYNQVVTYKDATHTYTFYPIKDHENYVAIKWAESVGTAIDHLDIPSSFTSNVTHETTTVVAIARAGFSRCRFSTVSIPQTIEDIREEAFAYCNYLTTVQIPKGVKAISESMFLDCRSLTSVYYSSDTGALTASNTKITYIGDHAFDSCINLAGFNCPALVTFFGQSCFQRCSSLSVFRFPLDVTAKVNYAEWYCETCDKYYTDEQVGEDHLCPEHGTPVVKEEEPGPELEQNVITVKEYAFADCTTLKKVYFDRNLKYISNHAFADCSTELIFYFYGTADELSALMNTVDGEGHKVYFEDDWRKEYITTDEDKDDVYPFEAGLDRPTYSADFPGLEFYLTKANQKLDNARNKSTINIISGQTKRYAVIKGFTPPTAEDLPSSTYYVPGTGTLHIPSSIVISGQEYIVKVIDKDAFNNTSCQANLQQVYFPDQLVQIKNHAFYHCNNISVFDFSACTELKEISYSIFNEVLANAGKDIQDLNENGEVNANTTKADANRNKVLSRVVLPNSLEYLGNFAFYNCTNLNADADAISFKTDKTKPSNLKIIGDYAFAVHRDIKNYISDNGSAKVDLLLPNSLDDSYAPTANIYHSCVWMADRKGKHTDDFVYNRVAINKNAFDNQLALRTVKMESGGVEGHTTSLASNVFVRCSNILRFESNENLCLIGDNTFKLCTSMREIFLHADTAKANKMHWDASSGGLHDTAVDNPWGIADGTNALHNNGDNKGETMFWATEYSELVVYVCGNNNGNNNYPDLSNAKNWRTLSQDKFSHALTGVDRKAVGVPTYYVDWTVTGNVKYWHKNDSPTDVKVDFASGPRTLSDYNSGYISFVKQGTNYTVARYFTEGKNNNFSKTIDLRSSACGVTVDAIGPEAFGTYNDKNLGYYYVLPSTINSIASRAFYRNKAANGVRIVTFDNGGTPQPYTGGAAFSTIASGNNYDVDDTKRGYCCLPAAITVINDATFYNNVFSKVELPTSITKINDGAFYTNVESNSDKGRIDKFIFTDYNSGTSPDTNSYFTAGSGGLYYTEKNKTKALFQANTGDTGTLNIDSGVTQVYYQAAASSKFTSVSFNDVTAIGGQSFINCYSLASISNYSKIEYIGISGTITDISGSRTDTYKNTKGKAFENCSSLKVDFTQMTSIKKIGENSFKTCSNLVNLTLTKTYKFYESTGGNPADWNSVQAVTTNVLDLSTLADLREIGAGAFVDAGVQYAILPNTTVSQTGDHDDYSSQESSFKCGGSAIFNNSSTKRLCGETAFQADQSGTGSLNPKTHYPVAALAGEYSKLYYRVHSINDILAAGSASTGRQYWTAVKSGKPNEVRIILFADRDKAIAWLGDPEDPNYDSTNFDSQLHTFPEVVATP